MSIIRAIVMDGKDNVATLLSETEANNEIRIVDGDQKFTAHVKERIPFGHKVSLKNIARGEEIIKYGEVIGRAVDDIQKGTHVHVHNVESLRGLVD